MRAIALRPALSFRLHTAASSHPRVLPPGRAEFVTDSSLAPKICLTPDFHIFSAATATPLRAALWPEHLRSITYQQANRAQDNNTILVHTTILSACRKRRFNAFQFQFSLLITGNIMCSSVLPRQVGRSLSPRRAVGTGPLLYCFLSGTQGFDVQKLLDA